MSLETVVIIASALLRSAQNMRNKNLFMFFVGMQNIVAANECCFSK